MADRLTIPLPPDYPALLEELKARIQTARLRAVAAANRELIALYFDIGRSIVERQEAEQWGSGVIDRLAADLRAAFPEMEGFSPRNLRRMRSFYLAWQPVGSILPQAVAELPWGHNAVLLEKLTEPEQRRWYAQRAVERGWSRAVLTLHIEARLHGREGQAVSNFSGALPPPTSDLAQQATKDPYLFDFLTLHGAASEREVEDALVTHIERFLLELGAGFAFVGRQYHLVVGGDDCYIDLLFYHLKLRCFVVIELKARPFDAGDVGQLNLYLSAVDDLVRHPSDGPTIGLLLCKGKNRVKAEYALRGLNRPIGVADWETRLVESLPENLAGALPSVEELERELSEPGE